MRQKSAKDMAFEKEKGKLRSQIRELSNCLDKKEKQLEELNAVINKKDEIIRNQEEWINRLLEYTEISKEDMKILMENEKNKAKIQEKIKSTLGFIGAIGGIGIQRMHYFDMK